MANGILDFLKGANLDDPAMRYAMMQAGMGMLAAQPQGASRLPQGGGISQAIGQGGLLGLQGYGDYQQRQMQKDYLGTIKSSREQEAELKRAQIQLEKDKAAQEQIALAEQKKFIETLPPDQQQTARLGFKDFIKARIEQQFPQSGSATQLAKYHAEMAAIPEGDPRRNDYMGAIRKETTFAPQQPPIVIPSYTYQPVETAPGQSEFVGLPTHGGAPISTGLKPRREIPANMKNAIAGNEATIARIKEAEKAAAENPDAFGLQNVLGGTIQQYLDKSGVDARATVGRVGALERHDITGSSATKIENTFTEDFVPKKTDTPEAVSIKLRQLREAIESDVRIMRSMAYGTDEDDALEKRLMDELDRREKTGKK